MCSQENFIMAGKLRKLTSGPRQLLDRTRRCDILLKTILIGKIRGKRGSDRRQHSWLRNFHNQTYSVSLTYKWIE